MLPRVAERLAEGLDIPLKFCLGEFVGLSKDDVKGDFVFSQPINKIKIDGLWRYIAVYEDKEQIQIGTLEDVVSYHLSEGAAELLGTFGVAVSWQINEKPLVIDEKVINEDGLARLAGSQCEFAILG